MCRFCVGAVGLAGIAAGFFFYAGGRTMAETVGFNGRACFGGLTVALILSLPILCCLLLVRMFWHGLSIRIPAISIVAFVLGLLAGSLISEVWIVRDEAAFA